MKIHRRKSNKIPRTRLPNIERVSVDEPSMRFFQKIKNSLNLLEQDPNQEQQKNKHFLIHSKRSRVSDRIQRLSMNKNRIPRSLFTSIETTEQKLISQRGSRIKRDVKHLLPKIQSQEEIGPAVINSKPLGDKSIQAYQMKESQSPRNYGKLNMETASEIDSFEDDDPKSPPIQICKGFNFMGKVNQQIKKGKEEYLFNRIMGEAPYEDRYVQFHRKLIEKDRAYEAKKFRMNHKSDWRG